MLLGIQQFWIYFVGLKLSRTLGSLSAEPGSRVCVPQMLFFLSLTMSLGLTKFPTFPKHVLAKLM